jgi:hypothetical protein
MKAAIYKTPEILTELLRLVSRGKHNLHITSEMDEAYVDALAAIASGEAPESREGLEALKILLNKQHPLSNPDNVARAVILGSPELADEIIMKGYVNAAPAVKEHIKSLVVKGLDEGLMKLYRGRMETVFKAPGLVLAGDGGRPSPEALKSSGYSERPETAYIPQYRNMSDERLYRLVEGVYRPTQLGPLDPPENMLAKIMAATIIRSILENRYTMVAYTAADVLSEGGPMTVFGPVKTPLLTHNGLTANIWRAIDIVDKFFRAAGHRPQKTYLPKYFEKILSVVRLGERLVGRRLDIYDLRGFYEAAGEDILGKVREDIKSIERGGGVENAHMVVERQPNPYNPLQHLHIYLNITPYLTSQQLHLLENIATSIAALTITPTIRKGYTDKVGYMRLKLKQAKETARILTQSLIPAQAYIPTDGPKGLDRISWALIANLTTTPQH